MPDENQTVAWNGQVSQQSQSAVIQPWDDFVLDFWDWEEVDNTEQWTQSQMDLQSDWDINSEEPILEENNMTWEESVENQHEQVVATEPVLDNEEKKEYADFDMSLWDDLETQNVQEVVKDENESKLDNWDEQNISDDENSDKIENQEMGGGLPQNDDVSVESVSKEPDLGNDDVNDVWENEEDWFSDSDDVLLAQEEPIIEDKVEDLSEKSQQSQDFTENTIEDNMEVEIPKYDLSEEENTEEDVVDTVENDVNNLEDGENPNYLEDENNDKIDLSDQNSYEEWDIVGENPIADDNSIISEDVAVEDNSVFDDENEMQEVQAEADSWTDFVLNLAWTHSEDEWWQELMDDNYGESTSESVSFDDEDNWFLLDAPMDSDNIVVDENDDQVVSEEQNQSLDINAFSSDEGAEQNDNALENDVVVDTNDLSDTGDLIDSQVAQGEEVEDVSSVVDDSASIGEAVLNSEVLGNGVVAPNMDEQSVMDTGGSITLEPVAEKSVDMVSNDQVITNNQIVDSVVLAPEEQKPEDLAASIWTWTPNEWNEVQSNSMEDLNVVKQQEATQVQSTLSLDQILDTELLSNPNLKDNSTAIPVNTVSTWGFFSNKKVVWVLAWVGIFLLATFVVVLAFPSGDGSRKPNEVVTVNTGVFPDIPNPDETHWTPEEPEINVSGQDTSSGSSVNPQDPSWLTWDRWTPSGVFFPAVEDPESSSIVLEPEPYIFVPEETSWGQTEETPVIEEVSIDKIRADIFSFKSQAEIYYSAGQDTSDKQLMKYATQMKYLCENYQEKLDSWEWIDYESYSTFRESVTKIISKINTYMGWWDDLVVIQNLEDTSYFEGKEELLNYIQNR